MLELNAPSHHLVELPKVGQPPIDVLTRLYGGVSQPVVDKLLVKTVVYRTSDGGVSARQEGGRLLPWPKPKALVHFKSLESPEQATRWTALQAVRARAGLHLEKLHVVMPSLMAATEDRERFKDQIAARREAAERNNEPPELRNERLEELFALRQELFVRGADSVNACDCHTLLQDAASARNNASMASVFEVNRGQDLPDLTQELATRYEGMAISYGDSNPAATVAGIYGADSLDHLYTTWDQAMSARTPLEAGRIVLDGLMSPQ